MKYKKSLQRISTPSLFPDPSLTKQDAKDSCDINTIVKTWLKTGQVTHKGGQPFYNQIPSPGDLQDAIMMVNDAYGQFNDLPAHVRNHFGNSPTKLLEFVQNPENYDDAIDLGLIVSQPKVGETKAKKAEKAAAAVAAKNPPKTEG